MSKYKIAWLPGDGIGKDVMDATKVVLDRVHLEAEYVHGDIGWEFWCKEGDAFPQRTVELLKNVNAAMFGAITSKPVKAAEAELAPELKGKGLVYRSPIVRMRQLFDLYICLRPCKAYPGNPLNFKEGIDLVVFRENTEDLYAGVEFNPVPREVADILTKNSKPFAPFKDLPGDQYAISCKINTKKDPRELSALHLTSRRNSTGKKSLSYIRRMSYVQRTGYFLKKHGRLPQSIHRFSWMTQT
jgi:isocitrate/isopropylmalate dehydrogenase